MEHVLQKCTCPYTCSRWLPDKAYENTITPNFSHQEVYGLWTGETLGGKMGSDWYLRMIWVFGVSSRTLLMVLLEL